MKALLGAVFLLLLAAPASAVVGPLQQGDAVGRFGKDIQPSGKLPLFDAFEKFCLRTGARPDVVAAAMAHTGIHKRVSTATVPHPMDLTSWSMVFEGHSMTLNIGHAAEPYGQGMVRKATNCSILSWDRDENASLAALRRWAAVPPNTEHRGVTLYPFETRGAAMVALKNDDAGRFADAQGRTWLLSIVSNSVMLMHYGPPTPRN